MLLLCHEHRKLSRAGVIRILLKLIDNLEASHCLDVISTGTLNNFLFSDCALPSIQFKTRAFWRQTRGLPTAMVNFLQFRQSQKQNRSGN